MEPAVLLTCIRVYCIKLSANIGLFNVKLKYERKPTLYRIPVPQVTYECCFSQHDQNLKKIVENLFAKNLS